MPFCVMSPLFSLVLFYPSSLWFGRLAHMMNCESQALSEKNVRVVQNPSAKSARKRLKRKLEPHAGTTYNHKAL